MDLPKQAAGVYDFAAFLSGKLDRWLSDPAHPALPLVERTLALAGKVLLDEILVTAMIASTTLPSRSHQRRIAREVEEAVELFGDRGWLDKPAGFHLTPPELEAPSFKFKTSRGLPFRHLRFESGYEPHAGEPGRDRWMRRKRNRTAHAWVLQHDDRPRPWLLCIHGYGMGFPLIDMSGFRAHKLHREMGMNLIFPVLPLHGPRRTGTKSGEGFVNGDHLDTVHAVAQAMWDIRRLLSWVRRQNAPSVGVYGLSLGGYNAALLAALEGELDCAIAGVPAICFFRFVEEHTSLLRLFAPHVLDVFGSGTQRVLSVVSPLALPPAIPHERRYMFGGIADRFIPAEHVLSLWEHWERPRTHWFQGSHISAGWDRGVSQLLHEALHDSGLIQYE